MPTKSTINSPRPIVPLELDTLPMAEYTEKAYLQYSMYVILDRALPYIGDGLKPVQRRIIYAMSDLGLHATAKHKKSARTVGDVLGKFHPHGDAACYEAMVLMAQSFSYRYPLIDGQGNWGSQDDPKSFAAMRYTESRLTRYAKLLLEELDQGTTDWIPNFDGTLEEPKILPARLPNVLLNGTSGIAVGMATDIPPHNVREVVSACLLLLAYPKSTLEQLCDHIKGPDFPTEAEIISTPEEILEIYRTGYGALRQRAVWQEEGGDIVITALPYQASGSKIQEQIAAQMLSKKLPMVSDIRDESDHENPIRIVIEPRSNRIDADNLMQHLFATTDLERSSRVNLNMIGLNGRPQVFDLKSLLAEWLEFRVETVRRRLQFRYDKVTARLHILDGLLIAYLNLDEVIQIIRYHDEPRAELMHRFSLSPEQTDAILDTRLRHLARLEEMKIRSEQEALTAEQAYLQTILNSSKKLKQLVHEELSADAKEYGDSRRSPITQRKAARALNHTELLPTEPITVILSENGWIRAAKGHDVDAGNLNYKAGDSFLCSIQGKTNEQLLALDSNGRTYSIVTHTLPSARSFGEPLSSSLDPKQGAIFRGLMMGTDNTQYLLSTSSGYGFVTSIGEMSTRIRAGKATLKTPEGAAVLPPRLVHDFESDYLAIITSYGRLLILPVGDMVILSRGKGVKMINLKPSKSEPAIGKIVDLAVFREGGSLRIYAGKTYLNLKPKQFDNYVGLRSQRGKLLPRGYLRAHKIELLSN